MHDSFKALMPLIIPEGVSDYFEMTHYSKDDRRLDIFLEELNITPEEYQGQKLVSKGFFDPITLQDFPIRGLQVYLHVKRRRWLNLDIDKAVYRNWELVAKGTRITQDFAAFLKEISG
ncbi:ISAon1 family transposase N-terminal region protein [Sphingobacterium hungaricum]